MNRLSAEKVLIVAAHPDDEVLGCGGTIARLSVLGIDVHLLILSNITTSREIIAPTAEGEAEAAAELLNISSLTRLGLEDNCFDKYPLLEIIQKIEKIKKKIDPDLIFCHDYTALNIDHRITHQAVITAFRPLGKKPIKLVSFESISCSEYQDKSYGNFAPNFYVDVTAHFDKKISAFECYKSEIRKYPHPRSIEGIKLLAKKRGMEVGIHYAEAFRIIREIV